MSIAYGGFGPCGTPTELADAVLESGVRDLTLIGADVGCAHYGIGRLIAENRVARVIAGYVGANTAFQSAFLAGRLEVELCPMGNIAERLRAGGAGISAFFTPVGVGSLYAESRESRWFDGREYILEEALRPDLGLVHAWRSDEFGNLRFRKTARNFNPVVAMAAHTTVVQIEQIHSIDPDSIHVPRIYVDRIVKIEQPDKRIEHRTVRYA